MVKLTKRLLISTSSYYDIVPRKANNQEILVMKHSAHTLHLLFPSSLINHSPFGGNLQFLTLLIQRRFLNTYKSHSETSFGFFVYSQQLLVKKSSDTFMYVIYISLLFVLFLVHSTKVSTFYCTCFHYSWFCGGILEA